ncbi:hypothetical protein B7C62_10630 [Kitasatospora albolonga]|uniref:Uncharacterized protein n=1 Tax=Kitasatospora albolonga TaxID=68173 RepID=A0ABC8BQW1_9ACTN|nr:hypothetical protein B7C62_10630 [Kitasatospora albolonga]
MAWDEWEQIKAEVTDRHADQMRLSQLAPAGESGGTTPDLCSSPAKKAAAVKAIDKDLELGVERGGKHADESVNAAVKEFGARDGYGWDTSSALKKAHETWGKQVKMLLGRLASEKEALSRTGIDFQRNELDIAARMRRQSRIDSC